MTVIACNPRELPEPEHRWLRCGGCGAFWWSDEECECTCVDGDEGYETWTEVLAGLRDASWYATPGTAWQYHVALGTSTTPTSACNQRDPLPHGMVLAEFTFQRAVEVPERMRCMRPGCRVRWPR